MVTEKFDNVVSGPEGESMPRSSEEGVDVPKEKQNPNTSLRSFSKKYAPRLRNEIAQKIRTIRAGIATEMARVASENEQRAQKREAVTFEMAKTDEEIKSLETEIDEAKLVISRQKNSFLGKIMDVLNIRDVQKRLGIAEMTVQHESMLAEQEARQLLVTEYANISLSDEVLDQAQNELEAFYADMGDKREAFEAEAEARSVENISRDNHALFIHMIGNGGYQGKPIHVSFGDAFDLNMAVQPTLSTSTLRDGDKGTFGASGTMYGEHYNAGIIIGRGRVLTTRGSNKPQGLFSRRNDDTPNLNFQDDAVATMPKAIQKETGFTHQASNSTNELTAFNEFSVESVEPKAILVEYSGESQLGNFTPVALKDDEKMRRLLQNYEDIVKRSQETGMPIIVKKDGKLYMNAFRLVYKSYKPTGEIDKNGQAKEVRVEVGGEEVDVLRQTEPENIYVGPEYNFDHEITVDEAVALPTPTISPEQKIKKIASIIRGGKIDPLSQEMKELRTMYAELGGNPQEILNFSVTRQDLDAVLTNPEHTPEDVINLFGRDLAALYDANSYVMEAYTIREHTLMVMNQYKTYFGKDAIPNAEVLLALHDIGKPQAVTFKSAEAQHRYTMNIVKPLLRHLGFDNAQITFAESLLGGDPVGEYLQSSKPLDMATVEIAGKAIACDIPVDKFMDVLLCYYMSDAGSYTTDAGGVGTLDKKFVFDRKNGSMSLAPELAQKFNMLKQRVIAYTDEQEKKKSS